MQQSTIINSPITKKRHTLSHILIESFPNSFTIERGIDINSHVGADDREYLSQAP